MTKVKIMLDSIAAVKKFVSVVSMYDFDVDLASGRYAVDAKSIMGIFSLDLSNPIQLVAHTNDATTADERQETVAEVRQKFEKLVQTGTSGEEAFIQVFCDQMEIPYEKLTSAEFTAFLGILRKSKKAKRTKSMRGKGSPIPPNRNGRQKR